MSAVPLHPRPAPAPSGMSSNVQAPQGKVKAEPCLRSSVPGTNTRPRVDLVLRLAQRESQAGLERPYGCIGGPATGLCPALTDWNEAARLYASYSSADPDALVAQTRWNSP